MAVNDGSANAPVGSPQVAGLLDSYGANRPAWSVAGVDYHVGVPDGLALKNPATISMAGVSVNATTHMITITGSNVTLDGYDFSLNGGWGVTVQGANAKIMDSNFLVGANHNAPILGTTSATNLYVGYSTIDGSNDANVGGLVEMRGSGTVTVEYSWLKNSGGDMIQMHTGGRAAGVVIENNLIQNAGMAPGAHGDYTEFMDGPYTATILYNTTTQNGGTTQGFMVEPDIGTSPGKIVSGEIGYNTFTAKTGINAFTAVTVADIQNTFTVHDNYFDSTGTSSGLAFGGTIRGGPDDNSSKSIYVHNVNMKTGSVLQDANAPSSPPVVTPPAPTAPNAPVITSGDHVTNDNTVTVTGTAVAGSTVTVFDGAAKLGTATVNSGGAWTYTTAALSDGKHSLTATDTSAGKTSAASSAATVTVDTHAPAAPVPVSDSVVNTNHVLASGTAEANSTIKVYDGTTQVGTATTNASGAWTVTTSALAAGTHGLTATATDVAGNVSAASQPFDPVIGGGSTTPPTTSPTPTPGKVIESAGATSLVESGDKYYLNSSSGSGPSLKYHGVDFVDGTDGTWAPIAAEKTTTGYQVVWKEASTGLYTAWNTDNNGNYVSHVSTLTGSTSGGSVSGTNSGLKLLETSFHQDLNGDGQIGASSAAAPTQINSTGQVVATSGETMVGTDRSNTLTSTTGNDVMVGKGGADTFVFASNFGKDVITDFTAGGRSHDTVQFSKSVFDSFAGVLSHAAQSGTDVVISTGSDTLTLKNTKVDALHSYDFHFA